MAIGHVSHEQTEATLRLLAALVTLAAALITLVGNRYRR